MRELTWFIVERYTMHTFTDFAPSSYHLDFAEKAVSLGYRLVGKVEITTNDMPYHVDVDKARVTCFTFDVPGKAFFVHFSHVESTGFMGDAYDNHWYFRVDIALPEIDYREGCYVSREVSRDAISADLDNVQPGWSMGSGDCFTFTGDVIRETSVERNTIERLETILRDMLTQYVPHAGEKFQELMTMWEPHYIFTGSGRSNHADAKVRQDKLKNMYWERFGEGRKILREKIIRSY